jgi:polygalacturonase
MNRQLQLEQILVTPRSACFELSNGECYRSAEPHEALLDGRTVWRGHQNVFTLNDLQPGTAYQLLVRSGGEERRAAFATASEGATVGPRAFGGVGDGRADETSALQRAIDACPAGGRVFIPEGDWLTTPLFLRSDRDLHLARGARVLGHPDIERWPVLPALRAGEVLATWEGEALPSHAGLITGIEVRNVRIYGEGVIDGNASRETWWSRPKGMFVGWRPRTIHLIRSQNIAIEGVTLCNSPSWTLHPFRCRQLIVARVKVEAPTTSPNTDGINPECCEDVRIAGVQISTGDDCIAIKSGKRSLAQLGVVPTRSVRISNSLMQDGHGAIVIGSELACGVYDVLARDCLFVGTERGLRLKTRRGRGRDAIVDGVRLQNVRMEKVGTPFVINSFYWCDPDGKTAHVGDRRPHAVDAGTPSLRNISLEDVVATQVQHSAGYVLGLPEHPPENLRVKNYRVVFDPRATPGEPDMAEGIVAVAREGFRLLNVRGLSLENLQIEGADGPDFIKDNVT